MGIVLETRLALKSDTSTNWSTSTIVLLRGEIGFEVDTNKFKFGDGVSTWNELSYCETTISVDNKTLELKSNGQIQLLKFDTVTSEGKQLRTVSDGASGYKIEWFTPDINSISGLETRLSGIETDVSNKANISSLSTVATTGSYNDLLNKPSPYTLPSATNTVLGGVKTDGTTISSSSGVISVNNNSHTHTITNITGLQTALDAKADESLLNNYILASEKGKANGVATLDTNSKIPTAQLPSYVSDVFEFANLSGFPVTGEANKIYVAKDTNKTYRWSGTQYTEISASLSIGTITGTAYDGGLGNALSESLTTANSNIATLQSNYNSLGTLAHKNNVSDSDIVNVNTGKLIQAQNSSTDLLIFNCGTSSTVLTTTSN